MRVDTYFSGIFVTIGLFALLHAAVAEAHLTSLHTTLVPMVGGASPIVLGPQSKAKLTLTSSKGGVLSFSLTNATNAGGQKISAMDNTLRLQVVINGTPQTLDFPFNIANGKASVKNVQLGLVKPDLIEIVDVQLLDASDVVFGTLGVRIVTGP